MGVYMHILKFRFRLLKSPPGKMLDRLSRKNITDPLTGHRDRLSCLSTSLPDAQE
jgi:hypothetical protein